IGVIPVVEKQPRVDYWKFLAVDSLRPLHDLIYQATGNPGREPLLLYEDAVKIQGLIKISGSRLLLNHVNLVKSDFYVSLSPSAPNAIINRALARDLKLCACSDIFSPRKPDVDMSSVVIGKRSKYQTYPRHILSDAELREACWQVGEVAFS